MGAPHIYDISSLKVNNLTLILLTWRKWWAPNNASKEQMGFNSGFKGLIREFLHRNAQAGLLKLDEVVLFQIWTNVTYIKGKFSWHTHLHFLFYDAPATIMVIVSQTTAQISKQFNFKETEISAPCPTPYLQEQSICFCQAPHSKTVGKCGPISSQVAASISSSSSFNAGRSQRHKQFFFIFAPCILNMKISLFKSNWCTLCNYTNIKID